MSLEESLRDLIREIAKEVHAAIPAKATKAKVAAAPESALPAAAQPQAASAPAPQPAPAAPILSEPILTVAIEDLNKIVKAVASVERDVAVSILAKFGVRNTAVLKAELYRAVYDEFEEAKAKLDAKSTQNQSLV
jgi:hypothetical protein